MDAKAATMTTYIATIGDLECDITAEWQFPAKGRHHAFTWLAIRYTVNGMDSYALASDTFKAGDYSAFSSGMSEARALRVAERSARRQHAVRIR